MWGKAFPLPSYMIRDTPFCGDTPQRPDDESFFFQKLKYGADIEV
jgi:hypothetical protein